MKAWWSHSPDLEFQELASAVSLLGGWKVALSPMIKGRRSEAVPPQIVNDPRQAILDRSIAKTTPIPRLIESCGLEFRAMFLNHPRFVNPDNALASATFGVISHAAVNPRGWAIGPKASLLVLFGLRKSFRRSLSLFLPRI